MRHPKRGFTLPEVLISIAVIAIGFVGAISALAFGMFSSQQAQQMSFAQGYAKKVLEIIAPNPSMMAPYLHNFTPLTSAQISGPAGTLWLPLNAPPFDQANQANLFGAAGTQENSFFQIESQRYSTCIVVTNVSLTGTGTPVNGYSSTNSTYGYLSALQEYTVYVRWNLRGVWRYLTTSAYFTGNYQP